MNKGNIRRAFDRAAETYDNSAGVQRFIAKGLVGLLKQYRQKFNVAIDMACGTGESTKLLAEDVDCCRLDALDFSPGLLSKAQQKLSGKVDRFLLHDFEQSLYVEKRFDLVFSNMGLQWAGDLKNTLSLFHSYLSRYGYLAFSIPVKGNFFELKRSYRNNMLSFEQVKLAISTAKFQLLASHLLVHKLNFPCAFSALKSVKSVGANFNLACQGVPRQVSKSRFKDFFCQQDAFSLTYKVGIFLAKKVKR